tara:strand:+ start:2963 stop:4066 length:1104 start_codon:yes stop_codon:yes gene_type:complete
MINIVFIVQQLSQPRCIKRIQLFRDAGYNCHVFGFNNGLYTDNLEGIDFDINEKWYINKSLNKVKKIGIYKNKIEHVINQINSEDIIYAFGFEIGSIVSFLWKFKFIYEEADVSASRINNSLLRKTLVYLDKRIIRKSILTIFTSEGFQDYLFPDGNPYAKKTIFIHNKLHHSFLDNNRPFRDFKTIECIKFGFVGLIRYPNTIVRFAEVIGTNFPNHEFHFFGEAEGNCLDNINWTKFSNIKFHGKFKNPEDLPLIYNNIDINIVCYDPASGNVRIAEPNKLYESIFFNVPLVVSQGTFLQRRVKELKVGYSINALSNSSIIHFVESLNTVNIRQKIKNSCNISTNKLVNNPLDDMSLIKKFLKKC